MRCFLIILFFYSFVGVGAQQIVPLQNDYNRAVEKWYIQHGINEENVIKPFFITDTLVPLDSILSFGIDPPLVKKSLLLRKWTYEPLVAVSEDNLSLNIDPLFDFSLSKDFITNDNYYTNSRGIRISGDLSKEFFFETNFIETQASFPDYTTDYINASKATPGYGHARVYKGGFSIVEPFIEKLASKDIVFTNGFDYSIASGKLSFKLKKNFKFSLGHGKFFVGDGYRSLLLSDYSYNYPFLKVEANYRLFSYSRIMAVLMGDSIPATPFGLREKRLGGFNVFTFKPNHIFRLSLFEGTIWDYPNSVKQKYLDVNYFNPVVLSNSVIYRGNHFSLIGLSAKLNFFKTFSVYGQIALNTSKQISYKAKSAIAYQVGVKYFDVLGMPNLYFQIEYNIGKNSLSNSKTLPYSNFNQALAHPAGVNFNEYLLFVNYSIKKLGFGFGLQNAIFGNSLYTVPAAAPKIFVYPYKTPFIGNSPKTNVESLRFSFSYLLNAFSNRKIEFGYHYRKSHWHNSEYKNGYLYFSFKTSISQHYYDF